jgi:hypothetical protein
MNSLNLIQALMSSAFLITLCLMLVFLITLMLVNLFELNAYIFVNSCNALAFVNNLQL